VPAFHVLRGLDEVPASVRGAVIAIGNFDGCHRGHQHVFSAANDLAEKMGAPSVMLTFEPHPRDVFAPEPFMFRLSDGEQKARLAVALGFDAVVIMPFSRVLAAVEAADFVSQFLVDALGASAIVVGADFHFGRARAGTPKYLAEAGMANGFAVHQLDLIGDESEPISSSRIRDALIAGETATANRLLGYHWVVEGTVIEGDKRGRELGYPTANFALPAHSGLAQGVYAVRLKLGNRLLDGVAAYGKPMFDNVQPPFEVHIFDFDEDIYGRYIHVDFIARLRGQEKYERVEDLVAQMHLDADNARSILAADAA